MHVQRPLLQLLQPEWEKPLQLQLNPDVSIREVGVMEKCTFCVQRIKAAKTDAKAEKRALVDGALQPACAQACPTTAIVFGDLNDPESRVARLARSPRGSKLLEDLGAEPKITYLQKQPWHDRRLTHDAITTDRGRSGPPAVQHLGVVLRRRARCRHRRRVRRGGVGYQIWYGIGVSRHQLAGLLGLLLTNFVFWIGISHAGTLISAILRLVNATWRRPVTRCAEVITVFALMIGAMFPIIHLGARGWRSGCSRIRARARSGRTSARRWRGTSSPSTPISPAACCSCSCR